MACNSQDGILKLCSRRELCGIEHHALGTMYPQPGWGLVYALLLKAETFLQQQLHRYDMLRWNRWEVVASSLGKSDHGRQSGNHAQSYVGKRADARGA